MEWIVSCDRCGDFSTYQKGEPLSCPLCGATDINTEPADGERPPVEIAYTTQEFVSSDGKVKVILENIGEGQSGDYDPNDPDDINYLRFTVQRHYDRGEQIAPYFTDLLMPFAEEECWLDVSDASYCTLIRADAPLAKIREAGQFLLETVESSVRSQTRIKKLCESLSWTSSD